MQGVTAASPSLQKSSIKSHGLRGARYQPLVSTYTKKEHERNNSNCTGAGITKSQAGRGCQGTLPCLLEFWSREEAALDRLSIELGCVHWGRRDWDWEVSFTDKPPVMSMLFTFMFGFSPAGGRKRALDIHNTWIEKLCLKSSNYSTLIFRYLYACVVIFNAYFQEFLLLWNTRRTPMNSEKAKTLL